MNYMKIDPCDMNNGDGVRVSLFVSGCSHGCDGCFNVEAWKYNAGEPFTEETLEKLLSYCAEDSISGLTLLGGDPLAPRNVETITMICKEFKRRFPNKDIWMWTGYTYSQVSGTEVLNYVDYLIDGKYEKDLPTKKPYRGSDNQVRWKKAGEIQFVMID